MNNKDKKTLTKATEILRRFFEPGNAKISRMRNQQNIWLLEDNLTELGDTIEMIEKIRDSEIKAFDGLCEVEE